MALPMVLNETAERKLFGNENAVGKRVRDDTRSYEVVGVVGDLKNGIGISQPVVYLPLTPRDFARPPAAGMTIIVRADAGADALARISAEIASIDPSLSVFNVQTLGEYIERRRASTRFSIQTYGGIGVFGLVLAAVGLAGITAYSVAQRRREIAIRTALGASRAQVLRLVMREGAQLVAAGTVLGFLGAMVMEKILSSATNIFVEALRVGTDDVRSRGQERQKERPLLTVESDQGYIHYRKGSGSVVLYYMKEMIGEDAVNRALCKLIHQYGYASAPYPTSYALINALRDETPPNLQYLIKDLFEDITLFSNRTLGATAVKRADGSYDVTIDVEARKFKADAKGEETEVQVDDWIDIGAFAKPASGRLYGETLYRERMHITQRNSTFTFRAAQLPEKAGIDPFALLIDRLPDDNIKSVTLESPPER
jgi:hypothetical protein